MHLVSKCSCYSFSILFGTAIPTCSCNFHLFFILVAVIFVITLESVLHVKSTKNEKRADSLAGHNLEIGMGG